MSGRLGRTGPASRLIRPSLDPAQQPESRAESPPRRDERAWISACMNWSAYLHADLSREQADTAPRPRFPLHRPAHAGRRIAAPESRRRTETSSSAPHKTPTLPVLDRAWFEERFAMMRTSMDRLAEQLPLNRLEALESQFRDLMDACRPGEDRARSAPARRQPEGACGLSRRLPAMGRRQ